jgi:hypothetical protein
MNPTLSNTAFSLLARILERILSTPPTRLMGQNYLICTTLAFLCIREIKVTLRLLSNFPLA